MRDMFERLKAICKLSISRLLFVILAGVFIQCYFDISKHPFESCEKGKRCFLPAWKNESRFQLIIAVSTPQRLRYHGLEEIYVTHKFDIFSAMDLDLNLTLPSDVRRNGTAHIHLILSVIGKNSPMSLSKAIMDYKSTVSISATITRYMIPPPNSRYLLQQKNDNNKEAMRMKYPISYWIPQLHFHTIPEPHPVQTFEKDFAPYIKFNQDGKYFPLFYVNELETSIKDLLPLNNTNVPMPLKLSYSPASVGDLRIFALFSGMFPPELSDETAEQSEHLRSILFNTNFYWLKISLVVACVHVLLEAISFKKDISFWKSKESMQGLSLRTTIWRCVSRFIIIFHLWDQGTSKFLLIPVGITALVEIWKIFKLRKIHLYFSGWKIKLQIGTFSKDEQKSMDFDYTVTRYLVLLLMPVFFGYCVYCLIYKQYTGWQSFISETSVHGVYAFGFLFMIPQLLLNYKLKSVAHLPLTALAFKVCSTFIDDFFAIVVKLPTVHRIACFRDDIVLFIYIIQWWIYPADRKRVNEYGKIFSSEESHTEINQLVKYDGNSQGKEEADGKSVFKKSADVAISGKSTKKHRRGSAANAASKSKGKLRKRNRKSSTSSAVNF